MMINTTKMYGLLVSALIFAFLTFAYADGVEGVASVVPSAAVPRPVNENIYMGMNSLLDAYGFSQCAGEPYFFVSPTPSVVVDYLDALNANGYAYEPLFQVGDNPLNTVTLARVSGNGTDVYSMFAVSDGSTLMLCDAS